VMAKPISGIRRSQAFMDRVGSLGFASKVVFYRAAGRQIEVTR
jgi:hypothetical protein